MKISSLSIHELQQAITLGDISALEIAQYTLKAIDKYNPVINAWTTVTRERILKEACKIDQKRQQGNMLSQLAGVPYAVKNIFDVVGYTTLAGTNLFKNSPIASEDAWVINRLNKSDALLTGMVNMDAYAYGFTTENTYYGATRNPHDLTRIAGGSSGGSAAAVAAGIVHFSLGTDTNGSIRVPSSLCGVFGLKPTFGRLSRNGSHPFVSSLDHVGIFARSVEDLTIVYDIIQGYDIKDKFQSTNDIMLVSNLLNKGINGIRCAILGDFFSIWCSDEAREAIKKVEKALDINEEVILPYAEQARAAAFIITAVEGSNHYLPALRKMSESFEPNSRERLLAGTMIPAAWYVQSQRFRRYFQQQVLPLFNKFDILIAPATPCCATKIGQQIIYINGEKLSVRANMGILTQPISFLGLPVCTVPIATSIGLPIGLQLIAAPFKEELVLRIAWTLQQLDITLPQIQLMN